MLKIPPLAKLDAFLIFITGICCFTWGLSQQEIISFDTRFYLFALEMWRHGPTWFPTTYQTPYPDYPATATFLIYLCAKLAGGLNKWIAVLPTALAASLTLVATYLLGALQSRRWGRYAVGFLLFTLAFVSEARSISLDMFVCAITTWSIYLAYRAEYHSRKISWFILSLLFVGGFAIRGPLGLIIPVGVLCVFYLLQGNLKKCCLVGMLGVIWLLLCTVALLTLAWQTGGEPFMQQVLHMEILSRLQQIKTPPFYFYWRENFGAYAVTYPLAWLILLGVGAPLIQRSPRAEIKFLQILGGWMLVVMVGLSIPADKKVRYVLAIAPALALICAYLVMVTSEQRYLSKLRKIFCAVCVILPALNLIILAILYRQHFALNYPVLVTIFSLLQIINLFLYRQEKVIFFAAFAFLLSYILLVEKINLQVNQTQDFVRKVEDIRQIRQAKLAFYQEGKDGIVIKYLINMSKEEYPLFVGDLKQAPRNALILTSTETFIHLPAVTVHKILEGKIGRDAVVVFIVQKPH